MTPGGIVLLLMILITGFVIAQQARRIRVLRRVLIDVLQRLDKRDPVAAQWIRAGLQHRVSKSCYDPTISRNESELIKHPVDFTDDRYWQG